MGKTILTPNQHKLLECAAHSRGIVDAFYLTGGTALAEFYLHHRLSEDLDFFSEKPLSILEILKWVKDAAKTLQVVDVDHQTLKGQEIFYFHFLKDEVVRIDFAYFPFPHVGKFAQMKQLRIASMLDIGVNKIQALMTRNRARDYFDLYEIMRALPCTAKELQQQYRLKFDVNIPSDQLVKKFLAIVHADDQPKFLGKVDWENVEKFFLDQAKKLGNTIIGE